MNIVHAAHISNNLFSHLPESNIYIAQQNWRKETSKKIENQARLLFHLDLSIYVNKSPIHLLALSLSIKLGTVCIHIKGTVQRDGSGRN
jgi:hypothetical protein